MKVSVLGSDGTSVGSKDVLTAWEHRPMVPALLHQAVVTAAANRRIPRAHTKGRGEVRGGGRKPWKQKGTGRARHGSIRSPLWRGGGVTFGPRAEEMYAKRFPAAMRRVALGMALKAKVADGEITLVERFPETVKTKDMDPILAAVSGEGSRLIVVPVADVARISRTARNIPRTRVVAAEAVTAADVLSAKRLVSTTGAWDSLETRLQGSAVVKSSP